jgi:hypothetical protein
MGLAWLQARTRGGDDEEEVSKLFVLESGRIISTQQLYS